MGMSQHGELYAHFTRRSIPKKLFFQLNDLVRGQLTALQERLQLNLVHQSQLVQQLQQCRDKKLMASVRQFSSPSFANEQLGYVHFSAASTDTAVEL